MNEDTSRKVNGNVRDEKNRNPDALPVYSDYVVDISPPICLVKFHNVKVNLKLDNFMDELDGRFPLEDVQLIVLDGKFFEIANKELSNWLLVGHSVTYKTDLTKKIWLKNRMIEKFDNKSQDTTIYEKAAKNFNRELENIVGIDKSLFAYFDSNGNIVALACLIIVNQTDIMIDMIGTEENSRNRGIGSALHSHLLYFAAEEGYVNHIGATDINSFSMQKIYEKNGSVRTAEQIQIVRK